MDYFKYSVDLLKSMTKISSESQNEEAIAYYLNDYFTEIGMQSEFRRIENKSCYVIGRVKGTLGKGRKLLLGGHIDTVSTNNLWDTDPYTMTEKDGKYYGLGCADMKGGLSAQISVIRQIIDEGKKFAGEIEIACLCDEERYSIGANDYVEYVKSQKNKANFAILAEPHYNDIVIGATGKVLLEIEIKGLSGHAATPEKGINAIDCMSKLINEINFKYQKLYEGGMCASHCFLRINSEYSGYSLNIPEKCLCLLNKQLYENESEEGFIKDIKNIYNDKINAGNIEVRKKVPYYPSYVIDENNPDLKLLINILKKHGIKTEMRINQSVSDANILYSDLEIPTVLFGPQGIGFHKENEYLVKDSMKKYEELLYQYIQAFFRK